MKEVSKSVCMLVNNSVTRDARVIKEAKSLADHGYKVLVIGLKEDAFCNVSEEILSDNLRILRVFDHSKGLKVIRRAIRVIFIGIFLLLYVFCTYLFLRFVGSGIDLSAQSVLIALYSLIVIGLAQNINKRVLKRVVFLKNKGKQKEKGKTFLLDKLLLFCNEYYILLLRFVKYKLVGRMMLSEVVKFKPAVVHCHDIGTLSIGVAAKKKLSCKLIYDAHEIYEEAVGVLDSVKNKYKSLHQEASSYIDAFITINESIIMWYKENYPCFPDAVLVMNATAKSPSNLTYDGRLHKLAGLPSDEKIVLFQGGFTDKRGVILLAEAAAFMPEGFSVVFMGWGKLKADIEKIAERVNGSHNCKKIAVIPPAPQEELRLWTAGATLGMILYEDHGLNHRYCTPNKLWEYPNALVPVIVTPRVEMKKMVETYRYGWVLPEPITPEYIGEFISSLSEEEIESARKCCEDVVKSMHWGKFENNLCNLYSSIL